MVIESAELSPNSARLTACRAGDIVVVGEKGGFKFLYAQGKLDVFLREVTASGGQLVSSPGGVLTRNQNKCIIGAVGSTGDGVDADEACAIYDIHSVGLLSDPPEAVPGPYTPPVN